MRTLEYLRVLRFGIIGMIAAAVHLWVVVGLVELAKIEPLKANIGGFAVAFWCSYLGHRHWTFSDRTTQMTRSLVRFLVTAILGFVLNEFLFYLLLHNLNLPYPITLAIVIIFIAILTYLLSWLWAFRGQLTYSR